MKRLANDYRPSVVIEKCRPSVVIENSSKVDGCNGFLKKWSFEKINQWRFSVLAVPMSFKVQIGSAAKRMRVLNTDSGHAGTSSASTALAAPAVAQARTQTSFAFKSNSKRKRPEVPTQKAGKARNQRGEGGGDYCVESK